MRSSFVCVSLLLCAAGCASGSGDSADASGGPVADARPRVDAADPPPADAGQGADATPGIDASTVDGGGGGGGGQLVITEIMPNPVNIADTSGEYIEIQNVSAQTVDLSGVTIAYAEWTGGTAEPDASSATFTVSGSVVVPSGARVVLARSGNPGFPEDSTYSNFVMSNSETVQFRLRLYTSTWDGSEPPAPQDVLDELQVAETVSTNANRGLSWQLDPAKVASPSPASNDDPANFCLSSNGNAGIEYTTGNFGTPGLANDCN
jgi:hypothetical protein